MALYDPVTMWGTAPRSGTRAPTPGASAVGTTGVLNGGSASPGTQTGVPALPSGPPQQGQTADQRLQLFLQMLERPPPNMVRGDANQPRFPQPRPPGSPRLSSPIRPVFSGSQGPQLNSADPGLGARIDPRLQYGGADPRLGGGGMSGSYAADPVALMGMMNGAPAPTGFSEGGGMSGEGQRQVTQTDSAPPQQGPQQGPRPAPTPPSPPPTGPPRFARNDLVWIAEEIDPAMAAEMGFGAPGQVLRGPAGDFFTFYSNQGWGEWGDSSVQLPEDFNSEDFYYYFIDPTNPDHDLHAQYWDAGTSPVHRTERLAFVQRLYEIMQSIENGAQVPGFPGQTGQTPAAPPAPVTPGGYIEKERDAFRRPLTDAEQSYYDYVQAASTGQGRPSGDQQAKIQRLIDADLAAGISRPVSEYVSQVREAEVSNPGTELYHASRGVLPESQLQALREQASVNMGSIGQRFSSDTGGAIATAVTNARDARMMEGQGLLAQLQQNVANMEGQRENAAQAAVYEQYIRSLGLPPEIATLLTLLQANIGNTSTTTGSPGGAPWAGALGSGLQGIGGIAGAYAGGGTSPYAAPTTTPTVLPPNY